MNLSPIEEALTPQLPKLPGELLYVYSIDTVDKIPQVIISISEYSDEEEYYTPLFTGTIELALAFYIIDPPNPTEQSTVPYYIFPRTIVQAPVEDILADIEETIDKLFESFTLFVNLLKGVADVV